MLRRTLAEGASDGDDPLAESMRCISVDESSSEDLKVQLHNILDRFQKDRRYRNDERYLKLWMRYADVTDDADKVFGMLKSEGIGAQLALFWAAWAYLLEMAESYSRAAEKIAEGRARGAVPVSLLEDFLAAFHRRMLERMRLTSDTPQYKHWASSSPLVHDVRIDSLAKRWPRKMAKVEGGSRRPAVLTRTLGSQKIDVLGVLGEGAFAVIFSCKVSDGQRKVAVKVERQDDAPSLPWECFITLQLSERLLRRHREKTDNFTQPVVVQPEALFLYRDGCAMAMPHGSCGTLHDLVALYAQNAQAMPQVVAMHYAVEMLRFCRVMHSVSILHMDIKPDNWLLTHRPGNEAKCAGDIARARIMEHSLSLIDFGRAIDLSVIPQQGLGTAFKGLCCASSFACPAMIEGREWKHDADLFALGSCVYFMLHGVYLEVSCEQDASSTFSRWRPVNRCKRYWEVDLWDNLFTVLLNADYRATDTGGILSRLEDSLVSYLNCDQRSRELQECLRRQDIMCSDR
eukprot:g7433.t1